MRPSRWPLAILVGFSAAMAGCSSPTASCPEPGGISGQWTYRATRETPVRALVTGAIVVGSANCRDFHGSIDVVEVLVTGESRRLAGAVSGTLVDGTLVSFEASLGGESREHLARLAGDSLVGTWVESSGGGGGGGGGGGDFGGRRTSR